MRSISLWFVMEERQFTPSSLERLHIIYVLSLNKFSLKICRSIDVFRWRSLVLISLPIVNLSRNGILPSHSWMINVNQSKTNVLRYYWGILYLNLLFLLICEPCELRWNTRIWFFILKQWWGRSFLSLILNGILPFSITKNILERRFHYRM